MIKVSAHIRVSYEYGEWENGYFEFELSEGIEPTEGAVYECPNFEKAYSAYREEFEQVPTIDDARHQYGDIWFIFVDDSSKPSKS